MTDQAHAIKGLRTLLHPLGEKVVALHQIVPLLDASLRSCVIKICQAQFIPHPDTSPALWNQTKHLFHPSQQYVYQYGGRQCQSRLGDLLRGLVERPVYAGCVLDLARSLPMETQMIRDLRQASWFKEICAIQGDCPEGFIDFTPIFEPSRRNEPLHPLLPPNPYMCQHYYHALSAWRSQMSSIIHYPRANSKFMSHDTKRHYERLTGERIDGFTQRDYLGFEARTGIQLDGNIEVRQRWYKSGMKPRTYYAQGGIYGFTANLQNFFSELVNCTPVTNHVTRLRPSRLYCHPGQHFRIYDLTSFTSLMWSQKDFLRDLADFCKGVPMTMMRARDGLVCVDMGSIIEEYNEYANWKGPVNLDRCEFIDEPDYWCRQEVAGMLGVFGNLMTCTLPHGIIMSMWATDEDQINVAGDDGILPECDTTEVAIRETISLVGIHEPSKEFDTRFEGCIHLKRPILQLGLGLNQSPMIIWPSCATIVEVIYGVKDPRYRTFGEMTMNEKVSLLGREMLRFLRSIFRSEYIEDDDLIACGDYAVRVCRVLEGRIGFSLSGGRLTQCGDRLFWPTMPQTIEDMKIDPWIRTCNHRFEGWVTVQMFEYMPWDGNVETLEVGSVLECNPDPHLSFLVNCKYLEVEPVIQTIQGVPALDRLLRSFDPIGKPVNRYKVLDSIPEKFCHY